MLHFMALAIVLLTLLASYAIRRAEDEMVAHHDLERRVQNPPPPTSENRDATRGTKVAT